MMVFAGPCGVLPREQMEREVEFLAQWRDDCDLVIRAGAHKGQLNPNCKMVDGVLVPTKEEYVGLGEEGVAILEHIERTYDIPTCTELMNSEQVVRAAELTWAQVGARHCGNLPLLRFLRSWHGKVLLKRGPANTLTELLGAAAHLEYQSDNEVILCERGVVTHDHGDSRIRWRPDILAIAQLKADHPRYKVILDCSHSTGRRDLVLPMAKAGIAAGADGVMIEVMHDPDQSMTDSAQGVDHDMFCRIMEAIL